MVSELVTNCLRHAEPAAGDVVQVFRRIVPGEPLRIEVVDRGPGFRRPDVLRMPPAAPPGAAASRSSTARRTAGA